MSVVRCTALKHMRSRQLLKKRLQNQARNFAIMEGDSKNKPVEASMEKKLAAQFQPLHLEIINESYMHNVPKGSETHFKVVLVSDKFKGLSRIKKHRMVFDTLDEEMKKGVHALSVVPQTPEEWEKSSKVIEKSPPCRGGAGL